MNYYKNEHGVECIYDEEFGNLFIKNKHGRVYLVNRNQEYARRNKLCVVYKTRDGRIILAPNETQKRRVNRVVVKERELDRYLHRLKWNGFIKILARMDAENEACPTCGTRTNGTKKKKKET